MNTMKAGGLASVAACITLLAPVALAEIQSVTPIIIVADRDVETNVVDAGIDVVDVNLGEKESNDEAIAFDELCTSTAGGTPAVDYGSVGGQPSVQCHLLHLDPDDFLPAGPVKVPILRAHGTMEFDEDVLAIVYSSNSLGSWDSFCGHPDVEYPGGASVAERGLEFAAGDAVNLVAGDPKSIEFTMDTDRTLATEYDNIRVITSCTLTP